MPLTVLILRTQDGEHELACSPHASFQIGSVAECEIALEGTAVLPRHCLLKRVGDKRFQVVATDATARFAVNGVTAAELEVEVPFKFDIGGDVIEFDLVSDEAAAALPEETPAVGGPVVTSEEEAAGARASRRGYLLQPMALKPRARERVAEVIVEPAPPPVAAVVEKITPETVAEAPAKAVEPEEEESSPLLFVGLLICVAMIAAILFWQRHLDQAATASVLAPEVETIPPPLLTAAQKHQACEALIQAGAPVFAAPFLRPMAEEGDAQAMHLLAQTLPEGEESLHWLQQAADGGQRESLRDLVLALDAAGNPARNEPSTFNQLQQAALRGESAAWVPLGERWEHGQGTTKDVKQALEAYAKARAAGDKRAEAKLSASHSALDRAVAFIRSWNEVSVATLLDHVEAGQGKFFMLDHAPMEALLRLEEEMRARWPLRRVSVAAGGQAEMESLDVIQVVQPFQFEVQRGERTARGTGVLTCRVRRGEGDKWRVVEADDKIELTDLLPAKEKFLSATSLRELKPAFTHEEQVEEARLEILRAMRGIEETQDFKTPLTVLLNAVYEFPAEEFWKPFADTLCDRMARQLFAEGKWLDPGWAEQVHQLAERGSVSAMLLEGHLLAAGYGMARDETRSTAMYQKAFEMGKRRDARFYYAEALFQGRGVPQDLEKAGALVLSFMSRSKHPLEAYLAAHLLWRKAEVDPALWQDVYDTLSRVAEQHPPAKNLAGMVLLNHGQTTRERRTGFAAIKAAAEAGVVEAMKTLAQCYQDGIGCEKDFLTATTWKQKAAVTAAPRKKHYSEFEN